MTSLFVAALLIATLSDSQFRELSCTGVPHWPKAKRVRVGKRQIVRSAVAPEIFTIVEVDAMVGLTHYSVRRLDRRTFKGTATYIDTGNWNRQSSPVTCKVLR